MKDNIPVHKLRERSDAGMEMMRFFSDDKKWHGPLDAHRDDHYIFLFQESGSSNFMLDFKEFCVEGPALMYILPGQVHHILAADKVSGWFLAVDSLLVGEEYRAIFEHHILYNEPMILDGDDRVQLINCIQVLYQQFQQTHQQLGRQITYSLIASYVGMIAELYLRQNSSGGNLQSRPVEICNQFRNLLLLHFKTVKSPAAYAGRLNISLTYLNEVVKSRTGFPVSYWIHHELMLEAKRLLFYTSLSVKEISVELGFSDHTYFSRLFKKMAGTPAGKFRARHLSASIE